MNEEDKLKAQEKWQQRSDKLNRAGDSLQKSGNNMMGCGCLLTILVTLPILIFIFIL